MLEIQRNRLSRPPIALMLVLLGSFAGVFSACSNPFVPLDQQLAKPALAVEDAPPALVRIATCWTALPIAEDLVAAYVGGEAALSVDLMPSSPRIAEDLLTAGQADLAIVGRLPGDSPPTEGGNTALVGLGAISIVTHKDSPLRQISSSELAEVFTGHRLDWRELRAGNGAIEIVCQEDGSIARRVFDAAILGQRSASSAAILMPHDRGVVEYVAQHSRAIGYVAAAYIDSRVKQVAIDGTLPTPAEIKSGRYPLTYSLVILTRPDASREAQRIVAFAESSVGRQAIEKRHVSLR